MAVVAAVGSFPVTFFVASSGQEVLLPLSVLSFDGATLKAAPPFDSVPGLADWLAFLARTGRVQPAATAAPTPAMVISAVDPGTGGNNVLVLIEVPDPTKPNQFDITVSESETYRGLTPSTIQSVLGTATLPGSQAGLVHVVAGTYALPKTALAPTALGGADATTPGTLTVAANIGNAFKLEARRAGVDSGLIKAAITDLDTVAGTFTLTVTWTRKASGVMVGSGGNIATKAAELAYEITITAPEGGSIDVPSPGTFSLGGGVSAASATRTIIARA